jgi:hypothetical protein
MSKASQLAHSPNSTFGFRNRIINGDFRIDQRNAGASVTPTTSTYGLDRWVFGVPVASKFSFQQNAGSVTPPDGFTNYLGVTSLSAYTVGAAESFTIRQSIEGYNVADLNWGTANAKTVTISFWVRSSLTGTFGGALRNNLNDRSYPFSYTISVANTWEYKTITVAGDTTGTWATKTNIGISLIFGIGVGSTSSGTAGAWVAGSYASATGATSVVGTNGATFYITGVQLEKGTQATSFEYRQYGTELALCQRYYFKYVTGGGVIDNLYPATTIDNFRRKVIESPVAMRTASPSLVVTTSSGTPGYQWATFKGGQAFVNTGNTTTEVNMTSAELSAEL